MAPILEGMVVFLGRGGGGLVRICFFHMHTLLWGNIFTFMHRSGGRREGVSKENREVNWQSRSLFFLAPILEGMVCGGGGGAGGVGKNMFFTTCKCYSGVIYLRLYTGVVGGVSKENRVVKWQSRYMGRGVGVS